MKTIKHLTLGLLAVGLLSVSADAALISSKAALVNTPIARTAKAKMAEPADTASYNSKTGGVVGTSEQVKVSRTQNCTKAMDMASATCVNHCR